MRFFDRICGVDSASLAVGEERVARQIDARNTICDASPTRDVDACKCRSAAALPLAAAAQLDAAERVHPL